MAIDKAEKIWFDGRLVPWDKATVHVAAHVLHYGSSIFEGIRAYSIDGNPAVFCLDPHVDRLFNSAKIYRMEIPYTRDEINEAILETVAANGHQSCYIRPLVFRGYGSLGVNPQPCPVQVVIITMEWGAYLGPEAIEQGVDVGVSSWQRMAPNTLPASAKIGGQYINSQLIVMEAVQRGYVEGIALDTNGYVSEGSGENLFVVQDGQILTPPLSSSILQGSHGAVSSPWLRRWTTRFESSRSPASFYTWPTSCSSLAPLPRSHQFVRSTESASDLAAVAR